MRLLPRSLAGRLIALLLLGLITAQTASFLIFAHERRAVMAKAVRGHVQDRIATMIRLLDRTDRPYEHKILAAGSSRHMRFDIADSPGDVHQAAHAEAEALAATLRSGLPEDISDARVSFRRGRQGNPAMLMIAVAMSDGRWLHVHKRLHDPTPHWAMSSLVALLLAGPLIVVIVTLAGRWITRPLARLSDAAERFGRGETVAALPETGPEDIRRTTRAFNQMRERLERFVADRTRMLAAISHDLRTPITALRLRAEYIEDSDNRGRVLGLIDEMQRMTEATLQFAREESAAETWQRIDLTALVESVCEDYREQGGNVRFSPTGRVVYRGRPLALTRALRNLIANAVSYGEQADVSVEHDDEAVRVAIRDRGPGITAADRERVFEPFVRLESSRSRETGGIGLGLAIARTIARAHGGDIRLDDREGGGLKAILELPAGGVVI